MQRLLAEAVSRQQDPTHRSIVNRERPHPVEVMDEIWPPLSIAVKQDLRVGMIRHEPVATRFERLAKLRVVVDLSVEDDTERSIGGPHRLTAPVEIDDRKPAMAEKDRGRGIRPQALGVGSTVRQRARHVAQVRLITAAREARDATHQWRCPMFAFDRFAVDLFSFDRFNVDLIA